jgi:hypothetical protein
MQHGCITQFSHPEFGRCPCIPASLLPAWMINRVTLNSIGQCTEQLIIIALIRLGRSASQILPSPQGEPSNVMAQSFWSNIQREPLS